MCPEDRVKFDFNIDNVNNYFQKILYTRVVTIPLIVDRFRAIPLQLYHGTASVLPERVRGVSAGCPSIDEQTLSSR